MGRTRGLEEEILELLNGEGPLSVAFITRFLNERGLPFTRQKVERVLRKMVDEKKVVAFYPNGNGRKHYKLR